MPEANSNTDIRVMSKAERIKQCIQQKWKPFFAGVWFTVLTTVVGMRISAAWGAWFVLALLWIPGVLLVTSNWFWKYAQRLFRSASQSSHRRFMAVVLTVFTIALTGICRGVLWSTFTDLATFPESANAYVHWTSEPDIEIQANRYALLIEFGVDGSATKGIDMTITLDERYETVDSWLSSSDRLDKPTNSEFSLGFGPEDSPQETKEPPSYSYHDSYHSIEPNSSLYVYFQSDGPLKIDTVSLNGNKLKPVEGIGDSK
jgi:hypothetical protein